MFHLVGVESGFGCSLARQISDMDGDGTGFVPRSENELIMALVAIENEFG